MSESTPRKDDAEFDISVFIRETMNQGGTPFEEAVAVACNQRRMSDGQWYVHSREFPVTLNGVEFHIDCVLEFLSSWQPRDRLFVPVECKRVDPRYSFWSFSRARPEGARSQRPISVRYEITPDGRILTWAGQTSGSEDPVVQSGLHIRRPLKSEKPEGKEATEQQKEKRLADGLSKALTQAWRGAGGLATSLRSFVQPGTVARVIPLIVTTADMYVWSDPLSSTELKTGNLAGGQATAVSRVWYEANVSASLLPNLGRVGPTETSHTIEHFLQHEHRRTVAIANVDGLEHMLLRLTNQHFDQLR